MSNKKIKNKIKNDKKLEKIAKQKAVSTEILNSQNFGFLEADDGEETFEISQDRIKKNVSQKVAEMCFDLNLDDGPIFCKYSRNGRHLCIRNNSGYLSSFDTLKMNLHFEDNINDVIHDFTYLNSEDYLAVAQKDNVFIYNKQGVEIHAVRENNNVKKMEYLPYHFLLVTVSSDGFMKYQDTSCGKFVSKIFIKDKEVHSLKQNPDNAIIHVGHKNGTVSLWSPNSKNYLAKLLCHSNAVSNLEIDRTGTYMYTTGLDNCTKIWDVRNTYNPINTIKLNHQCIRTSLSQRNLFAVAYADKIKIYRNLTNFSNYEDFLYMQHRTEGKIVSNIQFKSYEDILTIGHSQGISNIIVPGCGDPTYDSYEDSPFMSKQHKKEREVKMLLDKIPSELIRLETKIEIVEDDKKTRKAEVQVSKKRYFDIEPRRKTPLDRFYRKDE